MSMLVLF